jgi:hypothetical protein
MLFKRIKKIPYRNVDECLRQVKKKCMVSPWIDDIFLKKKKLTYSNYNNFEVHRIKLKDISFKKPTKLKDVYKIFKKLNYELVPPEISLYLRLIYNNQPKGEWLRISVPFKSMIDSDGVPHLPKLGRALNKNFIETYWSYPDAVFHPHNDFLVIKYKVKK